MQQSNFIFGMIFLAFIVFITTRGELPTYLSLLRGSGNSSGAIGNALSQNNIFGNLFGNSSALSTGNIGSNLGNVNVANSTGNLSLQQAQQIISIFGME